jgi:hypothetical protein
LSAATQNTRNAQIEILSVYAWANLVRDFWNIPYSQALNPATTSNPDGYFLPGFKGTKTLQTTTNESPESRRRV